MIVMRTFLVLLLFNAMVTRAQSPPAYGSSEIYLKIKKLKVLGSVLYVAAHPDDENTRLLTWLSKDQLLRTGYLSLTRGDGGQNLLGEEQGIELGLIRTQELLGARRIDGGEQFFTRAFDFGYSKSTEEALRIWEKNKVLSDAVWVIRRFQPDVIITRFPPDNRAGHGHHSASAVIAHEAFTAAADKNAFPEQFQYGVAPWKAKRLLWNGYNFDASAIAEKDKVHIDAGGYNPLLGKSYGEIAAESRSQHKSQGFGVAPNRGTVIENFSSTDGKEAKQTLMDNITLDWNRVGAPAVNTLIDSILARYDLSNPVRSLPALVRLYKTIDNLPAGNWKKIKITELQDIIAAASGIWIDAFSPQQFATQGSRFTMNFSIANRQGISLNLHSIKVNGFDSLLNKKIAKNQNVDFSADIVVPGGTPVSQPYWLQEKMSEGSYNVNDQTKIGIADPEPAYQAFFSVTIEGLNMVFSRPVRYKYTDPVKGEIYKPLIVVPAAGEGKYGKLKHIYYDHIPDIYYFLKDTGSIILRDVKTAGKKIAYIEGAGDKVPAALALMGYEVTVLKEKDLSLAYLSQFDAVMTGVRAYNVHPFLYAKNDVLNEYVKNGGNLIVQYNVNQSVAGPHNAIGPYPFTISRNRITDEHAPVTFLLPGHPVLNYPNKITQSDFDNWIQERGLYFAEPDNPAFKMPLAMKDPGEQQQNGSLLIADYGKGKFVYTAIVFFRELPAGVNGAYRLLANIIALNKSSNE